MEHVRSVLGVSERGPCRIIGQPRSTQRRATRTADDEAVLTVELVVLATRYGRHGYRRITASLTPRIPGHGTAPFDRPSFSVPSHAPSFPNVWIELFCLGDVSVAARDVAAFQLCEPTDVERRGDVGVRTRGVAFLQFCNGTIVEGFRKIRL